MEKTITLGKKGTLHARRRAFRNVNDKEVLKKLFGPIAERYAARNGGYTRIIKIGNRKGDDAPMAFIELVGAEEAKVKEAKAKAKPKKEAETAGKDKKPAKKKEAGAKVPAEKAKKTAEKTAATKEAKKTATKKAAKKEDKK